MDVERLIDRHKDAVYRQMVRVCGNHDDAEDALVEALTRAYVAQGQLANPEAFRGWLAQIGRRVCFQLRRREALHPIYRLSEVDEEQLVDGVTPEQHATRNEIKGCVQRALETMPEPYRAVYVARELEGRTAEEVAKANGLTVAAVKSRLHRARAMVRETLDHAVCADL